MPPTNTTKETENLEFLIEHFYLVIWKFLQRGIEYIFLKNDNQ